MSNKQVQPAAPIAVIGHVESYLDRRERLIASRIQCDPLEENLRRVREAEYPVRIRSR